jgi:hypothetical protein
MMFAAWAAPIEALRLVLRGRINAAGACVIRKNCLHLLPLILGFRKRSAPG